MECTGTYFSSILGIIPSISNDLPHRALAIIKNVNDLYGNLYSCHYYQRNNSLSSLIAEIDDATFETLQICNPIYAGNTENTALDGNIMSLRREQRGRMDVWCPIIPYEKLRHIEGEVEEFQRINGQYDDWKATMRTKSMVGANTGIMLDRIRMMMMGVGIACAQNRDLALTVQNICSDNLRESALTIIASLPPERVDASTKAVLQSFFTKLKFTRDIIPEEDMRDAASVAVVLDSPPIEASPISKLKSLFRKKAPEPTASKPIVVNDDLIKVALFETTNVLKRLYMRLLSPDPWSKL